MPRSLIIFYIVAGVIIAGLAAGSAAAWLAAGHDKPLHRAYACALASDGAQEFGLATPAPAPSCKTPSAEGKHP